MSDIKQQTVQQQQAAVAAAHQAQQQQQAAQQQAAQIQQQMEQGQTIQVQQVQLAHDGSQQVQQIHPQPGQVQVIQQPIQNPTYLQQVYNTQGQLLMPGNIALHPAGMNQGSIQVITAGKAFQSGQMPHMLTQGKPIVQGQATSFPTGYATIPTSGNNQTLVISQLGVLSGQPNILQASPQQQGKTQDIQKMMTNSKSGNSNMKVPSSQAQGQQQTVSIGGLVNSQQAITTQAPTIIQPQILSPIQYTCNTQQQRAVQQGTSQAMQFAPWQATFGTSLPQGLTWAPGTIQSPILAAQGNQIFIRGPQQDQGMFIQNPPPQSIQQHNAIAGHTMTKPGQGMEMPANIQPKQPVAKTFSNILPNSVGGQQIRPASSVSTQTGQTPAHLHQANLQSQKAGGKVRTKTVLSRGMPSMTLQKSDAANQTKPAPGHAMQQKMILSNGAGSSTLPGSPQDKLMKQGQSQVQVQVQQQQQQQLAQVQQLQQQHQMQQLQMTQFQQQMQQKPQQIQTGQMMMSNGISGQIMSTPNCGERPVMPVVSMSAAPIAQGIAPPLMANMIVQAVPGIPTMQQVQGLPISATQPIPGVAVPQQMVTSQPSNTSSPSGMSTPVKQEEMHKVGADMVLQNSGSPGTGPGRPLAQPQDTPSSSENMDPTTVGSPACTIKEEKMCSSESESGTIDTKNNYQNKLGSDKGDSDGKSDKCGPPKAMVKPQVLTHVIEGFVIQEASEPFAVNRGSHDTLVKNVSREVLENGEPPSKKAHVEEDEAGGVKGELAKCEFCSKVDLKSKFKKSKRFCSLSCAKSSRVGLYGPEEAAKTKNCEKGEANETGGESGESNLSPDEQMENKSESLSEENAADDTPKVNPLKWTVSEVCDFIRALPGCSDYVEDFAIQEIDGQALMLLKEDHLMSAMSMKLGPALKIVAKIDTMRVDNNAITKT